jgi:hypothetical protein
MRNFISVLLLLLAHAAWSQSPKYIYETEEGQQINEKNVKLWPVKSLQEYVGCYHFGLSEAEWTLVVLKVDSHLIFQAFSGGWGADEKGNQLWISHIETFDAVALNGTRFRAGYLQGFFALYVESGKQPEQGIVLTNQDVSRTAPGDSAEYGGKSKMALNEFFSGKYPQLSYKVMDDTWLSLKSKEELQIMRNEIYARYGFRFVKGGKMDVYFRKQHWYSPQKDNVNDLLNEIERRNIEKILRLEK